MFKTVFIGVAATLLLSSCAPSASSSSSATPSWLTVDNFAAGSLSSLWTIANPDNETDPKVQDPQISEIVVEEGGNHYLLKKPAADGVVGNRKAISFRRLPMTIPAGETMTLYTRVMVEKFPNNHSFGLSDLDEDDIVAAGYDAFEPMIRITDKAESDGTKNDGTLMVLNGYKTYSKIAGPSGSGTAMPMVPGTWYEIWAVVNNGSEPGGGQSYDLYVRGGEFTAQTKVYTNAVFRMKREEPLKYFMTMSNTGPKNAPYGNGGVGYDDIKVSWGTNLTDPR